MIFGLGTDSVEIARIETIIARHGDRFLHRVFTADERTHAATRVQLAAYYAKRFAAKEACAKALGTGFRDGLFLRDIVVVNDPLGRPSLILRGMAARRAHDLMPPGHSPMLHLSLSDTATLAFATVILESRAHDR